MCFVSIYLINIEVQNTLLLDKHICSTDIKFYLNFVYVR